MSKILKYQNFIKSKGKPLAEINPGSNEFALNAKESFQAIELLKYYQKAVLGGDILSVDVSGKIIYAYQLWGMEYHCLDWYCQRLNNENDAEYCIRSYEVAKKSIKEAFEISVKLEKDCLVVLVV